MSPLDELIVSALNSGRLRVQRNGDRIVMQAGFGGAWSTISELKLEPVEKPRFRPEVVA